jgi:hypothetical protein
MNGLMFRPSIVPAIVALISAALSGCGDLLQEPDTGIATNLTLVGVSGDDQSGPPGAPLPQPIRVRLVDLEGGSTERLWVEWVVVGGSGTVESRHSFTDSEGIAETTWTLGPGTDKQRIEARVPGDVETFEAELCEVCPGN